MNRTSLLRSSSASHCKLSLLQHKCLIVKSLVMNEYITYGHTCSQFKVLPLPSELKFDSKFNNVDLHIR